MYQHVLTTVDTHTAGEPTRFVVAGVPFLHGTMAEKRRQLQEEYDFIRTTLMHEPRGHADMFGAILTGPHRPEADIGVVFMDTGGYLAMCGHGSIGAVVVALSTGLVPLQQPTTDVVLDTPAGLVRGRAYVADDRIQHVAVENVPGFLYRSAVEVHTAEGPLQVDISFGGNFFALVAAESLGLEVKLAHLPALIEQGMAIRAAIDEQVDVVHPTQPHINTVDLVEFYQDLEGEEADCRNVVVFGEAQVDRSPCGTGTSAKMAALYAKGRLALQRPFVNQSIIGTHFTGRLLREEPIGEFTAVVPEISGNAYITGFQQFVVDPRDPLKFGFHLASGTS
ncbi:MAG: proline racemase family protein [Anaerolineae bacterium]|jgi:proline racemase/trans-L-3-hydroxyproline dehydratase